MSQKDYKQLIVQKLLHSNNHIRGLANELKTNQTTISRKVQELQKENVVDFIIKGKNKEIFIKKTLEAKQYVYQVEAHKLIEIVKKYPNLRRTIELIKDNKKIKLIVLFGSYAKGLAKKNSDIDIYIDTKNKKFKEDIETINLKINVKIGKYNKESLLIKEIEKNHVIIKGVEEYYEKNKFFN